MLFRKLFPYALFSLVLGGFILSYSKYAIFYLPILIGGLLFFVFPNTRSALFHKIIISDFVIEIHDYLPKWFILIPKVQRFDTRNIRDVFFLSYDLKGSQRTSRVRRGSFYRMQIERDPNMRMCLVFRFRSGLNAYARYFHCLDIADRKEILRNIKVFNPKVRFRFGDFEKWGRHQ